MTNEDTIGSEVFDRMAVELVKLAAETKAYEEWLEQAYDVMVQESGV